MGPNLTAPGLVCPAPPRSLQPQGTHPLLPWEPLVRPGVRPVCTVLTVRTHLISTAVLPKARTLEYHMSPRTVEHRMALGLVKTISKPVVHPGAPRGVKGLERNRGPRNTLGRPWAKGRPQTQGRQGQSGVPGVRARRQERGQGSLARARLWRARCLRSWGSKLSRQWRAPRRWRIGCATVLWRLPREASLGRTGVL